MFYSCCYCRCRYLHGGCFNTKYVKLSTHKWTIVQKLCTKCQFKNLCRKIQIRIYKLSLYYKNILLHFYLHNNYVINSFTDSLLCDCGQIQKIRHIAEELPQTRYKGRIDRLHKGNDEVMDLLSKTHVRL